jgi:dGTPase
LADPFQSRRRGPSQRELTDLRPTYAIDVDRILHSQSYTRYIDKTQVFYLLRNTHITHRVIHVQMVSRIARTIGQKLCLNLDLIEAASLGHDLGHAPFGHDGESYLSELCQEVSLGPFVHAIMSLRCLERLEKAGRGLNLTLGVLDAILCHDGESDFSNLTPDPGEKSFEELDRRIALRSTDPATVIRPMTMEGCLVRICDSISYVGRDLEDAIEVGLINRDQLPVHIRETLGSTNGTIVYSNTVKLIWHTF